MVTIQSNLFGSDGRGAVKRRAAAVDGPPAWSPIPVGGVLLSIDPSSSATGWALLLKTDRDPIRLASGVVVPRARDGRSKMDDLAFEVHRIATTSVRFNGVEYSVGAALVELPYGMKTENPRSMNVYVRAVGICEAACALAGLAMHRMEPNAWKGGQKKSRTFMLVKAMFRYEPRDDNEADAICMGSYLCAQRGPVTR